jgi:hypothetical protein
LSAVKTPRDIRHVISEIKKDLKDALTSRKIPDNINLRYIRKIIESITYTDTVTGNPNKSSITETPMMNTDDIASLNRVSGTFLVDSARVNFSDCN